MLDLPDIVKTAHSSDTMICYQSDEHLTIRQQAIKEAAQELGIQSGLAWAGSVINERLEAQAAYLNEIYNFNVITLDDNILPPVIEFADHGLRLDDSQVKLSLTGARYRIAQKARFYTTLPSWRDYLLQNYQMPQWPDKVLLPKDKSELKLWHCVLAKAWQTGLNQAGEIYSVNIGRLTLAYRGMVLYHQLLAYHIVTPIHVKKRSNGVKVKDGQLVIDDKQWYLDMQAHFNVEADRWQPFVVNTPPTKP